MMVAIAVGKHVTWTLNYVSFMFISFRSWRGNFCSVRSFEIRTMNTAELNSGIEMKGHAQSVKRRATGWTALVQFPAVQYLYLCHGVQTESRAHPASYPMCTGGSFPRRQSGRGVKLTTHLYLVPRSRMLELYLHSPICLHGIVLNWLSAGTNLRLF
jgi:hypothetical protein